MERRLQAEVVAHVTRVVQVTPVGTLVLSIAMGATLLSSVGAAAFHFCIALGWRVCRPLADAKVEVVVDDIQRKKGKKRKRKR